MSLQKIWSRATTPNSNESLEKTSALRRKIEVGSFVVHRPSDARGVVQAVEIIGGHETLSFTDTKGRLVRGVSRHECSLANSERYAALKESK